MKQINILALSIVCMLASIPLPAQEAVRLASPEKPADNPTVQVWVSTADGKKGLHSSNPERSLADQSQVKNSRQSVDTSRMDENLCKSIALVLSNRSGQNKTVRVKWSVQSFDYKVPRQSMVTFA